MRVPRWFPRTRRTRFAALIAVLCFAPADAAADGRAVGLVAAWGRNTFGQVGPGSGPEGVRKPQEITETTVPGVGPNGTAIAAGAHHALVVAADGRVWAWGANGSGQLGDGTQIDRTLAGFVRGPGGPLTNVIAVAAGEYHSLALRSDGTVWAWGSNQYGQLGDGTTDDRDTAVQVKNLQLTRDVRDRVIAIAAGASFSLALQSDGTIRAWGSNLWGQLGDGTVTDRLTPVVVERNRRGEPLDEIKAIEAGYGFALALSADGTVYAWGDNGNGQLGNGHAGGAHPIPARVRNGRLSGGPLTKVIAIAGGSDHALALISDGTVRAWGLNAWGQLGDDTEIGRTLPVVVRAHGGTSEPLELVTAIAAGSLHSLALLSNGTVRAWGSNSDGELGDGTDEDRPAPVEVQSTGFLDVRAIAAGFAFSVDLHGDVQDTYQWGLRNDGTSLSDPFPLPIISPAVAPIDAELAGGLAHSLILTAAGHVFAWGDNEHGQLGDATTDSHPLPVSVMLSNTNALAHIKAIAAGLRHNLALRSDGTVWAWGANGNGQLGDGTTEDRPGPVRVRGPQGRHRDGLVAAYLGGIVAIAAGHTFSLALGVDGRVWAWGANDSGQLGDGTLIERHRPTAVVADGTSAFTHLVGVKEISAGAYHSLALGSAGVVRSWGSNQNGALGHGPADVQPIPGVVSGAAPPELSLTHVETIAAGGNHGLALRSDGTAWAWGLNQSAELGDGTYDNRYAPVQVLTGSLPFVHPTVIAAGYAHSLAISWRIAYVVPR